MGSLEENSIDLVVTSPPYDNLRSYNDSSSWDFETFKQVADGLIRTLKPGGVIAWNVADAIVPLHGKKKEIGTSYSGSSFRQCLYFMEKGLNLHDNLLYQKHNARIASGPNSLRHTNVYEYCFILSKGRPNQINLICDKPNKGYGTTFTRNSGRSVDGTLDKPQVKKQIPIKEFGARTNIWLLNNNHKDKRAYQHPALMPPVLAHDIIRTYTKEGDIVLDPFMGSGTTARQALLQNRKYVGYEIDTTFHKLCEEITPKYNLLTL